jgi:GT2 family glycosyltransferase
LPNRVPTQRQPAPVSDEASECPDEAQLSDAAPESEPRVGWLARVEADGKFFRLDGRPFRIRGATYGSFAPRGDGAPFPEPERVRADFEAMAAAGLNTVRTYALPPCDVLDLAEELDLRVVVGLHYDDWRMEPQPGRRAERRIRSAGLAALEQALERCSYRPNVLAISVGNEVPGDLVRLHGVRSIEETLTGLCEKVRASGTGVLATYTNFPTTEYLHVDEQDFSSFNVFLEDPEAFRAYVRHLQIVAGTKPLVITELGLAGGIHGFEVQADALAWQLGMVEEAGCAGATIFSWTDEWTVGGVPVQGWGFGLTTREREAKPALHVATKWSRTPLGELRSTWPRISVVVCARNEATLVERCLESLNRCDYPDLEPIFCDDGSTDETLALARRFPVRVVELEHGGLSRARNAGLAAATGEIVAYLDADAECHPEWPYHLALSLESPEVVATGGPNIGPADVSLVERAVDEAPGGPIHVLVSDDRAEHVPGCNMAFRKDALEAIGGFDAIFRSAGDDVDVCWKLLDAGGQIAFSPTAQVRHHRPATIGGYLRQQRSYGRSERMLIGRHPHRFNRMGQARWAGSIYGGPRVLPSLLRPIVYHGPMGTAPFQTVSHRPAERSLARLSSLLPLTVPLALLGALAPLSLWLLAAPALALLALLAYGAAIAAAVRPAPHEPRPDALRLLVAVLHVAQPFARAWGRLQTRPAEPLAGSPSVWHGDRDTWLDELLRELARHRTHVRPGGPHDSFDLSVSVGPLLACRVWTAVAWRWTPLQRTRIRPRPALLALAAGAIVAGVFDATIGLALGAGFAAGTVVELVLLRRVIRASLQVTTDGARLLPEQ